MTELAETFHLEPVSEGNPFVCKVGWRTRESDAEGAFWSTTDKPGASFFRELNPSYREGHGLLTLAPLSAAGVVRAMSRYAVGKVRRRLVNLGKSAYQGLSGLLPSALARIA